MKLILTQDVPGLGAPGDVVEVKDGYGRNYLMPRGFAIAWTRGGEKQVTQIKRARKVREVRDLGHANEIKQALEALTITMPAHAGETGRLFGSITNADVADAVKAAGGPVLDKRKVALAGPDQDGGQARRHRRGAPRRDRQDHARGRRRLVSVSRRRGASDGCTPSSCRGTSQSPHDPTCDVNVLAPGASDVHNVR